MKNKFIYVMTVGLMANGLMFANTVGYLPASKSIEQQVTGVVACSYALPAAVGMQQVQNTGVSVKGELPGTTQNDQRGRVSNSMYLPGTDTNTGSLLSEQLSR